MLEAGVDGWPGCWWRRAAPCRSTADTRTGLPFGAARRSRSDDHCFAQPVAGQRGQDLRARRIEALRRDRAGHRSRRCVRDVGRVDAEQPCSYESQTAPYRDYLVDTIGPQGLDGLRIVVDCANGAMFEAAPEVIRRLGADVVVINAEPNGRNINDHCGATHPAALSGAVVANRADLGLAFDGDGDRVHRGRPSRQRGRWRQDDRAGRAAASRRGSAHRRHRGRHGDEQPRLSQGDGCRRHQGDHHRRRRPFGARSARCRRLRHRRRAKRAHRLSTSGDDRRWPARRVEVGGLRS